MRTLADVYPGCQHVRNVGLRDASDTQVWGTMLEVTATRSCPKILTSISRVWRLVFRQR
ncbi:MAG: hypothetical protein ACKO4U_05155 [Caldilinea sp.]